MKMERSDPKRRHIKFRRRGITRRKHTAFRTRRMFEIKDRFDQSTFPTNYITPLCSAVQQ